MKAKVMGKTRIDQAGQAFLVLLLKKKNIFGPRLKTEGSFKNPITENFISPHPLQLAPPPETNNLISHPPPPWNRKFN